MLFQAPLVQFLQRLRDVLQLIINLANDPVRPLTLISRLPVLPKRHPAETFLHQAGLWRGVCRSSPARLGSLKACFSRTFSCSRACISTGSFRPADSSSR